MFTPEAIEERLARIQRERLQRDGDATDIHDPELDDLAVSAAGTRRFEFVRDRPAAPAPGTS